MSGGLAPERLGRYELVERIGRGTRAVVFRAHDPHLGRLVAVKVVEVPYGVSDAERGAFEQRFFEQARRAGRLSHSGIVIAHDVGKDEQSGRLFIVFEYVEGRTLAELLAAGTPFDWREALLLVGRVAEALQHAHENGFVHRDLRPANIVLVASGEPKVMDFGVARLETARMTLSSIRQAYGAPLYMSPEQAVGESVDARTDLFSLGAVAYRLLTGQDAFAAEDPRAILSRVVYDAPPAPSMLVPQLPPAVDDVIAHALAKSRKDRYPDAAGLIEDVADVLSGRVPRHSRGPAWAKESDRFQEALQSSRLAISTGGFTAGIPREADQTLVRRRRMTRGLAGLLALGAVVGLDLLRRASEAPAPIAPRSSVSPGSSPGLSPAAPSAPLADPDLPSVSDPDPTGTRLVVELSHTLKSGLIVVFVDDQTMLQERIFAPVKRSLLGLKLREGRLHRVLGVNPGRHRVRVQIFWDDERRSETILGTFKAGGTRRVSVELGRLRKDLSLEWR